MSACWFDFDGDGRQDIYAGNMWSSAGMRVSDQKVFQQQDPGASALFIDSTRAGILFIRIRGMADSKM